MADINSRNQLSETEAIALVELLFFAYRDFVGDADEMLKSLKFGRAHHRVLHFVGRDPGMTVAQLLVILGITKQSLSRVLKDLIEQGYIFQTTGSEDRRQRLLRLTQKGTGLWNRLVAPQVARFRLAAKSKPHSQAPHIHELLFQLINPENHKAVRDWIERVSIISDGN